MTTHAVVSTGTFYKGVSKDLRSPTHSSGKLTYTPGTTVEADGLDQDPSKDCGNGINFCRTLAEALRWGHAGTVVTLTVPEDEVIIDTGGKLRARRVIVGEIAYLAGAYLAGAYLGGAYGTPESGIPAGWKLNDAGFFVGDAS